MKDGSANRDAAPGSLGLDSFHRPAEDEGLSLDKLNRAFATMLGAGDDPYSVPAELDDDPIRAAVAAAGDGPAAGGRTSDTGCEINPRSILEAMLFVGRPDNQPLSAAQVAGLLRGVRPAEIDELVADLNAAYFAGGRPYEIRSDGAGYRLAMRDEFSSIRDRLYGRVKEAKLSPAAIDVLAVIAYNEPLTAEQVNELRGTASGPILAQLVRRELLRIERAAEEPRAPHYFTTPRFLQLFRLSSLADLPRSLDLDRQ